MKKIITLAIALYLVLTITPDYTYAEESNLIQNVQISLKSKENPQRLEVIFDLTEPINLSQGSSNIIYEFFTLDSINYKKDKSWSGYLNSYDNYPSGERKYSSGAEKNSNYSDNVPAAAIYTSTKTGAKIDVANVEAVRITVLRANGSGERITIYKDGTTSDIKKIEVPVVAEDKSTGIRLESTTAELPENTVLLATELTSGSMFNVASAVLKDVEKFLVFEITLEADGVEIQPDGKVKINIPIPQDFNNSNVVVYRIDNDGTKTPYSVSITTKDGVNYATFETDHFSTYVLAELNNEEEIQSNEEVKKEEHITQSNEQTTKDKTPKTGTAQTLNYMIILMIISIIGIIVFHKKPKAKNI